MAKIQRNEPVVELKENAKKRIRSERGRREERWGNNAMMRPRASCILLASIYHVACSPPHIQGPRGGASQERRTSQWGEDEDVATGTRKDEVGKSGCSRLSGQGVEVPRVVRRGNWTIASVHT